MSRDPRTILPSSGSRSVLPAIRLALTSGAALRLLLAMAGGVGARLGLLALSIVVGRTFGADDFGVFTYATGTALIVGQLATMGWPPLQNRLIPLYRKQSDWGRLSGLLRGSDRAILVSCIVAVALLLLASLAAPKLEQSIVFAAVLVPGFAFCILRRQQLAAFRKAHFGMLFDQGFGAICTVCVFLALGGMSLGSTVVTYAATTLFGSVIALAMVRRSTPSEAGDAKPVYAMRSWLALGLPIMFGMSSKLLLGKTDILLLGPLATMTETGLYGAAYRITYLLSFPQVVLMTVVTPSLGEAFAKENVKRVRKVAGGSLAFTAVTTLPLLAIVLAFAEPILRLVFGEEFVAAAPLLRLLVTGQAASCFALVFASMLMMGGRGKAFALWNTSMLAINVVLGAALISTMGALGAAISTTCVAFAVLLGQVVLSRSLWSKKGLPSEEGAEGSDSVR